MPKVEGDIKKLEQQGYRAYIIRQEVEYVVVAQSEEEAKSFGKEAISDDLFINDSDRFEARPMSYLPAPYDSNSLVYGNHDFGLPASEASKLPGGYNANPNYDKGN